MKMAWYFVQTLMGCIGSVGFAVLFNIRGRKLLLAAGGGALAWAVYLACTCNGLDIFAGLFFFSDKSELRRNPGGGGK